MTTGTAGNDTIDDGSIFSTTPNTIDALGGDDSIIGANSDDVIYGGAGADTITSNGANPGFNVPGFPVIPVGGDTVFGGDGDDVITTDLPGGGVSSIGDTVFGEAGNDMIIGAVFGAASPTDSLFGGEGNDTIDGNTGDDVIDAGIGNDLVIARRGTDTVDGGAGVDRIDFSADADSVDFDMTTGATTTRLGALIESESNINFENVIGTSGNDSVSGTSGDNIIETRDGDDQLFGGGGSDVLRAGGGDDLIVGGESANDRDELDYAEQVDGVTMVFTGSEAGTVTGTSAGSDTFSQIERFILTDKDDAVNAAADASGIEIDLRGGDDFVHSGAGADSFEGGAGQDELAYFDSTAAVTVDAVTETGTGGFAEGDRFSGFEIYQLSDFSDNFFGGSDGETAEGNDGNDTLLGNGGDDTLFGGIGADTIDGGAGADSMNGDLGVDTLSYASSNAGVIVSLATGNASGGHATGDDIRTSNGLVTFENLTGSDFHDILEGSGSINELRGGGGNDTIIAGGSIDTVFGGSGNDLIDAGTGSDIVEAGQGDDMLIGGVGLDSMDGGAGFDTVDYSASAAGVTIFIDAFATGGDATGDTLVSIENYILTASDDVIFGGATANSVEGGEGADYISTSADDDQLFGGLGADVLEPGAGIDTVDGGDGDDLLSLFDATSGVTINLNNMALSSADYRDDVLISIEGILGNGTNSNTLVGTNNEDLFIGGNVSDVLTGNGGADILLGQDGSDTINGGGGDDVLLSGFGDDTITGGSDSDTFLFALNEAVGEGVDLITDFSLAEGDFILFYGTEFSTGGATVTVSETAPGGNALLEYGTSSSVEIDGVTKADVDALPFAYFFAG